ncbi:MAG: S9 family peptidase [Trueperaceae bacterium]|nr:S9 family peptidase [Trueperaceae bacterium]
MSLLQAPKAKKLATALSLHGHTRIDHYYWLREKDDPDVISYLEAENAYCDRMMAHTQGLQETLFAEMCGYLQEDDSSVPVKQGNYYYYHRMEKGKPYAIYCRKLQSLAAPEEVLLDLNEEAKDKDFLELGVYRISPDHRKLAYSLDTTGYESYTIYIKDLETGHLLPEEIHETYYALEWASDSQTFFYNVINEVTRPYKIFRHKLGTHPSEDSLCFHEEDTLFEVSVRKTKDGQFLYLESGSLESSELQILEASSPDKPFHSVQPREQGLRYKLEHHEGKLYLLSNRDGDIHHNIMTAPVEEPGITNWTEFIPHDERVMLESMQMFINHLVIVEREFGLKQLRIIDLQTAESHRLDFPHELYSFNLEPNPVYETSILRLNYSSLKTPSRIYDYHMTERRLELKKQTVVAAYDESQYELKRLFATAEDGTRIPMSLVYKKGLALDGSHACFLYGYGSYGANVEPGFLAHRLTLLERGVIFAMAHIRGGGALGRSWYEDGKFLNKKNTFTDFIAAARHLIAQGYTRPERLAIEGRSAGGLLMGAVVNMAPELFKTAIAGVPFMDVITTMQDSSIPLTLCEYEEWGNPHDKDYYDYMLSYSPYDNIEAKAYPNLLVTAGLNDPRVAYWEPAKWTAKLRDYKTDQNHLLLKTNMGAGHSGASDRYEYLREKAFEYAFVLDTLGVEARD